MKVETKNKLLSAWQYCDDNDKSTEFMLEYMQNTANVDLDCVMNFIQKTTNEDRRKYNHLLAPIFNYRCKKCGSTYADLKKPLSYSNCIVENPITRQKCNGRLVSF